MWFSPRNRISSLILSVIAIVLSVSVAYAASYTAALALVENGTSAYTNLPVKMTANVSDWESGYYIASDGLDVKLLKGTTEIPLLLANDKLLFVDSIAQGGTNNYSLTTGNTPATSMPIILGHGGLWTTADDADLELGNNFEVEWDGYVNTASANYIISKAGAFKLSVSAANTLQAAILGTETQSFGTGSTTQTVYGSIWFGQSFTFTNSATINAVTVNCAKTGSPSGNLTYSIYATSGGLPTGSPLITNSVLASTVSASQSDQTFTFASSVSLSASTLYAVMFSVPSGDVSNCLTMYANNAGGYASGTALSSVDGGSSFSTSSWDVRFSISGDYNVKTATATSISSGDRNIKVTADTTNLKIYVDSVEKQSTALGGATVPDNANNWFFCPSGITPYTDYYKHTVSGTLKAWYQPNDIVSGTTLVDRQGGDEPGVISWGGNPAGLSAALMSFYPSSSSSTGTIENPETPGVGGGLSHIDGTATDTTGTFIDPLIALIADNSDLNTELVWWGFYAVCLLIAFVLAYSKFQHLFIASGAAALITIPFCIGWDTIPDIMLALMVFFFIGSVLMEVRQTI